MKADHSGTPAEQIRYAARWLTATEAKANARLERCRDCYHFLPAWINGVPDRTKAGGRCNHLGVATPPGSSCMHWEARS